MGMGMGMSDRLFTPLYFPYHFITLSGLNVYVCVCFSRCLPFSSSHRTRRKGKRINFVLICVICAHKYIHTQRKCHAKLRWIFKRNEKRSEIRRKQEREREQSRPGWWSWRDPEHSTSLKSTAIHHNVTFSLYTWLLFNGLPS